MKKAVVLFAQGFEEIEAITPADLLVRGGIELYCVGVGSQIVTGSKGITIQSDVEISQFCEEVDAVVIPGGMPGAVNLAANEKVNQLILKCWKKGKVVAAICAAPAIVLSPLGILDSKKATCFPGFENQFSESTRFSQDGVVREGNLITARGPGKAYAFGLEVLRALTDDDKVDEVSSSSLYQ